MISALSSKWIPASKLLYYFGEQNVQRRPKTLSVLPGIRENTCKQLPARWQEKQDWGVCMMSYNEPYIDAYGNIKKGAFGEKIGNFDRITGEINDLFGNLVGTIDIDGRIFSENRTGSIGKLEGSKIKLDYYTDDKNLFNKIAACRSFKLLHDSFPSSLIRN